MGKNISDSSLKDTNKPGMEYNTSFQRRFL